MKINHSIGLGGAPKEKNIIWIIKVKQLLNRGELIKTTYLIVNYLFTVKNHANQWKLIMYHRPVFMV